MNLWLLPICLMLTNGVSAHTNAPLNPLVGWTYVAQNGPATAIAPRVACSVQHVGGIDPIFNGELFRRVQTIDPPGTDVRFLILDHDVPQFATVLTNYDNVSGGWIVGGGASFGQVDGGTNYHWGGPDSKVLRWSHTGMIYAILIDNPYFLWRFDDAASADGDSGYAAFTDAGEYLGPISLGRNPSALGQFNSGGHLIGPLLSLIKDYLPGTFPPKPAIPTSVNVKVTDPQ